MKRDDYEGEMMQMTRSMLNDVSIVARYIRMIWILLMFLLLLAMVGLVFWIVVAFQFLGG